MVIMKNIKSFYSLFLIYALNQIDAVSQAKVYSNYIYDSEGKIVSKIFNVKPDDQEETQKIIPLEPYSDFDAKKTLQALLQKKKENPNYFKKNKASSEPDPIPLAFIEQEQEKIDVSKIVPKDNEFYLIPDNQGKKIRFKCLTQLKFKWVIFIDEEYTYFVFNQKVDLKFLNIPNIPLKDILSDPEIINYPQNTVLRLRLKNGVNIQYSIENDKQFLDFSHFEASSWEKDIYERTNTPIEVSLEEKDSVEFSNLEKGEKQTLTINNQEFIMIFTALPDKGSYYNSFHRKIFIQPSFQGLCLKILGSNHKINFTPEKGILKITPTLLKSEVTPAKSLFEIKKTDDFVNERIKLIDRYINHYSKMKIKDIFRLAFIDIQLQLGYEAMALLESESKRKPFIINNKLYYFYLGMAHFINQKPEQAIAEWKKIPLNSQDDLWYRIALCELGNPMWCFNQMNKMISILPKVNTDLRQNIARKTINFMCKTTNFEYLEPLKKTLKDEKNYFISQWLSLLNATDLYFKKNYFASMQVLNQIKKRKEVDFKEEKFDTLYQYLYAQNQLEQKNITQKQLLEKLSLIHRTWNSDSFGYFLKKHTANMHIMFNQPRPALQNLKFLRDRFPTEAAVDLTDKKIIQLLLEYIKNRKQHSPLKVINLFKTFEKIVNVDEKRFTILDEVAQQYIDLNLLKDAIELMKKNINNIGNDINEKISYSIKIAKLYEQKGESRESLKVYDSLLKEDIDLEKQNKILTHKIKSLLHLKEYSQVLDLTNNRSDPEFILLKSSVYFEKKEWEKTIQLLEELTLRMDPLHFKSQKVFIRILNNLAFSYFMMHQQKEHKKNELKKMREKKSGHIQTQSPAFANLNQVLKEKYKARLNERKKMHPNDPEYIDYLEKLEELGKKYQTIMKGQEQFLFLTRPREKKFSDRSSVEKVLFDTQKLKKYFLKSQN